MMIYIFNNVEKMLRQIGGSIILLAQFSACIFHNDYSDGLKLCLPYTVSSNKSIVSYNLTNFSRLNSKVDAEIIYHSLPNSSDLPYLTIEGNSDIIDRISFNVRWFQVASAKLSC
jgi:hypothetical protein